MGNLLEEFTNLVIPFEREYNRMTEFWCGCQACISMCWFYCLSVCCLPLCVSLREREREREESLLLTQCRLFGLWSFTSYRGESYFQLLRMHCCSYQVKRNGILSKLLKTLETLLRFPLISLSWADHGLIILPIGHRNYVFGPEEMVIMEVCSPYVCQMVHYVINAYVKSRVPIYWVQADSRWCENW